MLSFVSFVVLGFLLGMRHATDPDHVIAVTTIITKQRGITKAGLIGVLWGLGHTFTIFVVGGVIILFKVAIPPRVGLSMELAVGVMLILLGVLNLTGVLRWLQEKFVPNSEVLRVTHDHGEYVHTEGQRSGATAHPTPERARLQARLDGPFRDLGLYNFLRPLVIGVVHGLAGSAAVGLLVMATIPDPWWAIAYLLLFGAGTIAGMMLITALIAMPFAYTAQRFSGWNRGMTVASGLLSLSFGLFLSYQIGIVGGLFTSHPQWTPR
jgi:ABC-type nickel/cobalt efflux system permease component RcnA